MNGRIVIVSGPPGAGKSTVARGLALAADGPLAVHLHTDDFHVYVRKGWIQPWLPQAQQQNMVIMRAIVAAASAYALGHYEVVADGIVGPWFFEPWLAAARDHGLDLRYVCLMPAEAETVARATARSAPGAMTDPEVVRTMWRNFQKFPSPEGHLLDTSGQAAGATIADVRAGLAEGRFKLA